jgi:hypothetical protein
MKMNERVREKPEERPGRSELVDAATQEVVDRDDEEVRRIIREKLENDRPLLNPPETAEEDLTAELCESLHAQQ